MFIICKGNIVAKHILTTLIFENSETISNVVHLKIKWYKRSTIIINEQFLYPCCFTEYYLLFLKLTWN